MKLTDLLPNPVEIPPFFELRQKFEDNALPNPVEVLRTKVLTSIESRGMKRGQSVGVAVGSRGIDHLSEIVFEVVECLKQKGLKPVLLPAMGSHGSGNRAGQMKRLEALGIDEGSMGCPLDASMETEVIKEVLGEVKVYFSKVALKMDHLVCINRIKPHTKFKAEIESGILKMLTVGLGKQEGAATFHQFALKYGFYDLLTEMGKTILGLNKFAFGIGLVENAQDRLMVQECLHAENLFEKESELLRIAKKNLPKLPLKKADLLVIGRIGKDISGAGMDPNITGRAGDLGEDGFSSVFQATRLAVLDLSKASGGNALGIGNADATTQRLVAKMDKEATWINAVTGISLNKARVPIAMDNDRDAILLCLGSLGANSHRNAKILMIEDTLHLERIWASEAVLKELSGREGIQLVGPVSTPFDDEGNLNLWSSFS